MVTSGSSFGTAYWTKDGIAISIMVEEATQHMCPLEDLARWKIFMDSFALTRIGAG